MHTRVMTIGVALAALIAGSVGFVGESAAVGGTLITCDNSTAPAFGIGSFSPGLKKAEIGQKLTAKLQVTGCVADSTQLENALPSKRGAPASKTTPIATASAGVSITAWTDCLIDGVTTGGDDSTANEYTFVGKVGIKWSDINGASTGAPSSTAIVRGDLQPTFPPTVALHGIVQRGLGIGGDFNGTLQLTANPGDTNLSDCFVDGSPGAIVRGVQSAGLGTWSIDLP
jgi:hypothetical protein